MVSRVRLNDIRKKGSYQLKGRKRKHTVIYAHVFYRITSTVQCRRGLSGISPAAEAPSLGYSVENTH